MSLYYHQRNSTKELTYEIDLMFWNSFTGYIRRMFEERFFQEHFGCEIENGFKIGLDNKKLDNRMLEELGFIVYYIDVLHVTGNMPSTPQALSSIEFFFNYISKPADEWYESYIDQYLCTKYDKSKARLNFTIKVNDLFKQNRIGYNMKSGRISKLRSAVLDSNIDNDIIADNDKIVKNEVYKAVGEFRNIYKDGTDSALTTIANALERIKTLIEPNKKITIEKIIQMITKDDSLSKLINEHIKTFTAISNKCTIRHKETDRIEIEDKELKEYLFYGYYNLIRLLLSKLNLLS